MGIRPVYSPREHRHYRRRWTPPPHPCPQLLDRFAAIVGAPYALRDRRGDRPVPDRAARPFPRDARRWCCGRRASPKSRRSSALAAETGTADRAAGRQHRPRRRADPRRERAARSSSRSSRLNRVREVDPAGDTMTVEAGVILADAQAAADAADRLFPLSLASEGSCQIGGNLSTNAGGTAVLAYGNTRDLVLGVEVVLASGEIWDGLRTSPQGQYRLRPQGPLHRGRGNARHHHRGGAEALSEAARRRASPSSALSDPAAALALFRLARGERRRTALTACELMPRIGIEIVLRHLPGARDPLAGPHAWYVLLEISSLALAGGRRRADRSDLRRAASRPASSRTASAPQSLAAGGRVLAAPQRPLRGAEARGRLDQARCRGAARGGAGIHRARRAPRSSPVSRGRGRFRSAISATATSISTSASRSAWTRPPSSTAGRRSTRSSTPSSPTFGGTISAEHGIGVLKRDLLGRVKSPLELDLMRRVKRALDPKGIMNPGKVL